MTISKKFIERKMKEIALGEDVSNASEIRILFKNGNFILMTAHDFFSIFERSLKEAAKKAEESLARKEKYLYRKLIK